MNAASISCPLRDAVTGTGFCLLGVVKSFFVELGFWLLGFILIPLPLY